MDLKDLLAVRLNKKTLYIYGPYSTSFETQWIGLIQNKKTNKNANTPVVLGADILNILVNVSHWTNKGYKIDFTYFLGNKNSMPNLNYEIVSPKK